jgi:acyl-CoA thioester hydrolase
MRHKCKVEVRWGDMDAFGHVNNAAYLVLAQEARIDFAWYSRKRAGLKPFFEDMVVARTEIDYILPIYRGGVSVDVEIWVEKISNSSFVMVYEISSEEGLHARMKTVQVSVNMETKRSRRITDEEREFVMQYYEPISE